MWYVHLFHVHVQWIEANDRALVLFDTKNLSDCIHCECQFVFRPRHVYEKGIVHTIN